MAMITPTTTINRSSYATKFNPVNPFSETKSYRLCRRFFVSPRTPSRRYLSISLSVTENDLSAKVIEADTSFALKNKAIEISPALKGTSIFLLGVASTFKTSIGKVLADSLRYYFFDSDSLVEEASGGEFAPKSFKERDDEGFRHSETEVLKQLSSMGRLVVCAGDGAVQNSTNLALLRYGISVWIDVPLDMVANEEPVLSELAAQYETLRDGYATADATISLQRMANQLGFEDFNSVSVEDMAMEVMNELEKLTRVKKMMQEAARPF